LFSINARPSVIDLNLDGYIDDKNTPVSAGKRKGLVYSVQRYDRREGENAPCISKQMRRAIDYVEDTLALISKGPLHTFGPEKKYTETFEVNDI
jgi:hypothetical protein